MIKVAICDDLKEYCESIQELLSTYEDIEFVAFATDSESCISMVEEKDIDVLLLDICIEQNSSGLTLISDLLEIRPALKIIMLTGYDCEEYIVSAFSNGATDYIGKNLNFEEIGIAIRTAWENNTRFHPNVSKVLTDELQKINTKQTSLLYFVNKLLKLSSGEYEVLRDVYYGLSYKQIAKKRVVEENTVRTLASRTINKFECNTMSELIAQLKDLKIFDMLDNEK